MEKLLGKSSATNAIYTVYSFDYPVSDKKGLSWRNHGECTSREEALWICKQLHKCKDVARIEIRRQKHDALTHNYSERAVKIIDKRLNYKNKFMRFLKLFPAN